MPLTAKEIAEKYANRVVKVTVQKSSPCLDSKGGSIPSFEGRIVGWKRTTLSDPAEYVALEVIPPAQTKYALRDFKTGYVWTVQNRNLGGYAKKVYPAEITLPADAGNVGTVKTPYKPKDIPEWPHKCQKCGSPALELGNMVDCSNAACTNKYKTHSGLDLFLPKEMQAALKKPKVVAKTRPEVDANGILICTECKSNLVIARYGMPWAKQGVTLNMECLKARHPKKVDILKGDKMKDHNGRVTTYDGKKFV